MGKIVCKVYQRRIMQLNFQSIVKITSSGKGKEEIKQTYKVSITLQILGREERL